MDIEAQAPAEERTPMLRGGQILAGRYQVAAFLGWGAVGEVYEAEDLELGERIAVKILHPGIAGDERVVRRFKQEIQLARRVTHPNVCRTYDLVYHREAPDAVAGLVFLTMELLRGETLADRLAQGGRMTPGEALPVVRQIAAALAAAHAAGVVHRDLKTANVFLERSPAGLRAVVNDFGLAWSSKQEGSSPTLTVPGELVGSPAYMAPEQVRGETATAATDVYALGVVLYEMVTGDLPFLGKSAFYTALKRLQEPPPSPREKVAELDPAWERAILRCLELEPADRFGSVDEVVHALSGEIPLAPWARGQQRPPRAAWAGAAACLLFLFAGALALLSPPAKLGRAARPQPAAAPAHAIGVKAAPLRRSVAVLGFENLSGDPRFSYLGSALFQMLPTELAAAEKLRLVPVENVDRARQDLALTESASLSEDTLGRLAYRLGADLVVSGSYLVTEGGRRTRIDVLVQDTRSGETVAALSESGSEGSFLSTLALLGERLRDKMGARHLSASEADAVHAALPATLEAARLYTEGLAKLRLCEAPRARDLLLRAVAAQPENPRFHAALASAWWDLGYREQARKEARRAVDLSAGLRHEDRRWIEARYHELGYDWEKATAIYQELASYFPDNLEYGLRLAAVQTAGGRGGEAATLAALHRLPPPLGNDPRIDLAEATAAGVRARYAAQRSAAERAARKGEALGARLLVAEAHVQEGLALQHLGDTPGAAERFLRAENLFRAAHSLRGMAEAMRARAAVLSDQSDLPGAKKLYEQATAFYHKVGDEGGAADTTRGLADLARQQGDLAGSESKYRAALAIYKHLRQPLQEASMLHEIGRLHVLRREPERALEIFAQALRRCGGPGRCPSEAAVLNDVGKARWLLRDYPAARTAHERSLELSRAAQDTAEEARALVGLGNALTDLGSPRDAQAPFEQALAIFRSRGNRSRETAVLSGMARALAAEGDYEGARRYYEEARAIRLELGERLIATESLLALAELALAHNHMAEGARSAREAARLFRQLGVPQSEARAAAVLARCQQGRPVNVSF